METSSDYMNQVKEELQNIFYTKHEDVIRSSLLKLGHNVTYIKSNLEKKTKKVTLVQINEKLDNIIELLRRPHGDC